MGIAVSTATDVAKSASGMVLTEPGLGGIVAAVKEGRVISNATIYAVRQRRHLWGSRPSLWLAVSSVTVILIASILSIEGIVMAPLSTWIVACTLAAAVAFAVVADLAKVPAFRGLGIA
jgi:hypothetical protein